MPALGPILEKLKRTHSGVLRATDAISAECWRDAPRVGAWSAAEVIAHLIMVEQSVVKAADRILQKEPRPFSFRQRFHVPFAIVEWRLIRRASPIPIDASLLGEKQAMLTDFRAVRERTLALIEATKTRDLSAYRWRHPFLGYLSAYEWFSFLGSHQIRHEKQMREIAAGLPKAIYVSQK